MAYAGGASPTGALGRIADAVSPPIAVAAPAVFTDISDIAIGSDRTLIVRREGSVWTIGGGLETPAQIPGLVDIYSVAAGGASSFAIDTAGMLWTWSTGTPVEGPFIDAAAVDASTNVAVVARWDGSVWMWDHAAGTAPIRVTTPPGFFAVDVAVGESIAVARSFSGDVVAWDPTAPDPAGQIATNVAAIAAGNAHVVLARTDGTVLTAGSNNHGQLGTGSLEATGSVVAVPGLTNIVDVAAGASHSVAVAADGTAYAWGLNTSRQLLRPTMADAVTAPAPALDVPRTARYAVAKGNATFLLSDPGTLSITHNIETYPFEFPCGEPFNATLSLTGFNASRGELNTIEPGLTDLIVTFNVTEQFERSGPVTVTAGSVTTNGTQVTWTVPSLGAATATLNIHLSASGPEGEFPVFEPFSYVSAEQPAPFAARYPIAYHRECAASVDQTPPVISSVTPSVRVLAPPNRQMVPITLFVEATDHVSTPVCAMTGVSSNEPMEDAGDWAIVAPLRLNLRAERSPHGNGRVYTIDVACVDEAGNSAIGSTTVTVPKGKHH